MKDKSNKIKTKKNKGIKNIYKNKYHSLIKSTVYVLTLLSIIIPSLLFLPSKSNAANNDMLKKYRYYFYLGKEDYTRLNYGADIYYEIYTMEPDIVNVPEDIQLLQSKYSILRYNNFAFSDDLTSGETGKISFLEYLKSTSTASYAEVNSVVGTDTIREKSTEFFKDLVRSITLIDDGAKTSDGKKAHTYRVWAKKNDYIQYVSRTKANDESNVPDDKYQGFYWGAYRDTLLWFAVGGYDKNDNFLYSINNHTKPGDPFYSGGNEGLLYREGRSLMYIDYFDEVSNESSGKENLADFLEDDRNIAYLVKKAYDAGYKFNFVRELITEDDKGIQTQGDFSYEVRDVNNQKGTCVVDVYKYDTNKYIKNKVYSFVYSKGGYTNVESKYVDIIPVDNKLDSLYSTNIMGVSKYNVYGGKNNSAGISLKFYSPENNKEPFENSFMVIDIPKDGYGDELVTGDIEGKYLYFKTGNNNYEEDASGEILNVYSGSLVTDIFDNNGITNTEYSSPENIKKTYAFAAVEHTIENNNCVRVIYTTRLYDKAKNKPMIFSKQGTFSSPGQALNTDVSYVGKMAFYTALDIPCEKLDSYFEQDVKPIIGKTMTSGNWHLVWDEDHNVLQAYNEPEKEDEESLCFFMPFSRNDFYSINTTYYVGSANGNVGTFDSSFKLHLKLNEDYRKYNSAMNFYRYFDTSQGHSSRFGAFLFASNAGGEFETSVYTEGEVALKANMFKNLANVDNSQCILRFYDHMQNLYDPQNRGNKGETLSMNEMNFVHNSSGQVVAFNIKPWISLLLDGELEDYKKEAIQEGISERTNTGIHLANFLTAKELEENESAFLNTIFKYAKTIFMFLVFIAVIYAGIFSIMNNQDAKQRVLVKEKMKHILFGCIAFASVVLILFLCKALMDSSFDKIAQLNSEVIRDPLSVPAPTYESNWLVSLVAGFINTLADIFQWVIEKILNAVVGSTGTDLNFIIFNKGIDFANFDLAPFTESEWVRYMYGYKALESLALALLAIAIIKFSIDLITNAGNSEKLVEVKQAILRITVSIIAILLAPYFVRLLLLLFNSLITLIPVRNVDLNLTFMDTGILGACANMMFVYTKFQIYLAFVVRKLMITFMLLITPLVFGLWSISDKFRSLSLWVGELVTNVATQFCYALVFFIATLIMYENQSDFVSLIIIMMFVKLADFFKDSLQGLVQKWGGIDETGTAQNLAGTMVSWGKKTINTIKKGSNKAGAFIGWAADRVDPSQISSGGRVARNASSILRGNIWGLQTKGDQADKLEKELKSRKNQKGRDVNTIENDLDRSSDPLVKNAYMDYRTGVLTSEGLRQMNSSQNGRLNRVVDYANAVEERDRYAAGAKLAKNEKLESKNRLDVIRNEGKDKAMEQYKHSHDQLGSNTNFLKGDQERYDSLRDDLANKTAELAASKTLNRDGKVSNHALLKQAESLLEQSDQFGNFCRDNGFKASPSQVARDEIKSALEGLSLDKFDSLKTFDETYEVKQKQPDEEDDEDVKAFKEKRNIRSSIINESLGLK